MSNATAAGFVLPHRFVFGWNGSSPTLLVALGFRPVSGGVSRLTAATWTGFRDALGLREYSTQPMDASWVIELGPYVAVRRVAQPEMDFFVRCGDPSWASAVEATGACQVRIGPDPDLGWPGVNPDVTPSATVSARYAGTFPAPFMNEVDRYHFVTADPGQEITDLHAHSFLLDADVVIDVERHYFSENAVKPQPSALRDLLLNLAYQDVLPGMALGQLMHPTRTSTDYPSAIRAMEAADTVLGWSREQIARSFADPRPAADPWTPQEELVQMDARSSSLHVVYYAGLLKMRQLWSPSHTLADRLAAFRTFMDWVRTDLRVSAGYLNQLAFNAWLGRDDAFSQAAGLIKFRERRVDQKALDLLWGTAWDLFLLGSQEMAPNPVTDLRDPILVTADAAIVELRNFIRPIGTATWAGEQGHLTTWGLLAGSTDLHPGLESRRSAVVELLLGLQADAVARGIRRESFVDRASELQQIATALEGDLLG